MLQFMAPCKQCQALENKKKTQNLENIDNMRPIS